MKQVIQATNSRHISRNDCYTFATLEVNQEWNHFNFAYIILCVTTWNTSCEISSAQNYEAIYIWTCKLFSYILALFLNLSSNLDITACLPSLGRGNCFGCSLVIKVILPFFPPQKVCDSLIIFERGYVAGVWSSERSKSQGSEVLK